jgi:hypothetical protein
MERRELLAILGAAAVAAPARVDIANYRPRFFTKEEYELVDRLTDLLIPSDGTPGAREAGVKYFLDTVLFRGDEAIRRQWREGLAAIGASPGENDAEIMDRFSRQPFFRAFKMLTVDAFAMSAAGQEFFGYKGNTAIDEFSGCQERA